MKKILGIFLIVLFFIFCASMCGGDNKESKTSEPAQVLSAEEMKANAKDIDFKINSIYFSSFAVTGGFLTDIEQAGNGQVSELELYESAKRTKTCYSTQYEMRKINSKDVKETPAEAYFKAVDDFTIHNRCIVDYAIDYIEEPNTKNLSTLKDSLIYYSVYQQAAVDARWAYLSSQGFTEQEITEFVAQNNN